MEQVVFAVDIGGTTCKMGLFTTAGLLRDRWEIPTDTANGGSAILRDVAASIAEKIEALRLERNEVLGVGVGVPGPVLADGTVMKCVNLGWDVVRVPEELGKRLVLPVKVGNDANVAALGELWQGGGRGRSSLIMVTLGTGVGGGIVVNGRILAGAHGAAGELGHLKMRDGETAACGCGGHGCLEQYASATGLVRLARLWLEENKDDTVLRTVPELTAKAIADAARAGDSVAQKLLDQLGETLGTALANVAATVDPEVIVIGGGVSQAGKVLMDAIEKHYRARAFHAVKDTPFALAELGNDAGIYGCARLML